MTILDHIDELRTRLIRILAAIGVTTLFSFTFGIKRVAIEGVEIYLPIPDPFENLASQAIRRIEQDVLPDYVEVIVTSPGQAIISQLYFSLFLGILISMPIIVREIAAFVNPALYPEERRRLVRISLPATVLFTAGCIFSYLYVTPFTVDFLYRYGLILEAQTFITLDSLISFILLFIVAFGLSFELPIIMWVVTSAGVVDPDFWRRNLTYAIVALAIYGAVITPDGSGITMWLVAGPMLLLYLLGYFAVKLKVKPGEGSKKV